MKTWQKWLVGIFGTLVLLIAAVVLLFDWNWLRAPLVERASEQTGRDIDIADLDGEWSLTPTIALRDIHIANAEWGEAEELFSAELVEVTIDLPELLRGRTVLSDIKLVKPNLALEVREDGTTNWDLATEAAAEPVTPDDRTDVPLIGRLDIQDGRLRYRDPKRGLNLDGKIQTAVAEGGEGKSQVQLNGQGTLQGEKFEISLTGGSLLSLREAEEPYPLTIDVKAVDSQATISGTLADPITFDGLDLKAHLQGPDLSRLTTISGIPFPITPRYDLEARLQRDGEVWILEDLDGEMGYSDLQGDLKFDLGRERLYVEADLTSHRLDYRDVGFLIGVPPPSGEATEQPPPKDQVARDKAAEERAQKEKAAKEQAAKEEKKPPEGQAPEERERVLPDAPLSVKQVRAVDARVKFRGDQVEAPNVPLSGVQLDLEMLNGVLHIKPLQVGVAGGTAIADVRIDARREPVITDYDVKLRAFALEDFFKSAGLENAAKGRIDGRIKLAGVGDTVRRSLGHSDGDIRLVVNQGSMSNLAIEVVGLDIAEALGLWAGEDKNVEIRCLVADLGVRKGIVNPRLFLLDTADSTVVVEGAADLRSEILDLTITTHPKDVSPLSVRTPITVKGSFAEPQIGIKKGALAARGAAAVALGTLLTPVAAILAFIEPGLAKNSDCASLVNQVQAPAGVKTPDKIEAPK